MRERRFERKARGALSIISAFVLMAIPARSDAPRHDARLPDLGLFSVQREGVPAAPVTPKRLPRGARGFRDAGLKPVKGMTIGPIESDLQQGRGYGSEPFDATLGEVGRLGGNWISLTVFGRVWDLSGASIDLDFEKPHAIVRDAVIKAVALAHARGLRVLLVPHLWVESGQWRAEIEPVGDERRAQWDRSYARFATFWAKVAEEAQVDMFAAGVELRSWVTTARAPSFVTIVDEVRSHYTGLLTYAANWDDAEDTVIWGHVDVMGINAFYPLHWEDDASYEQLAAGGKRVAEQVSKLAERFEMPVLFTEFGYTTRKNTAIKPWLWPEELGRVEVDQKAQARAYEALLGALREVPGFCGAIVWRMYADVADMSQEAEWGFSPWGKQSQKVLERAFFDDRFGDPPMPAFEFWQNRLSAQ